MENKCQELEHLSDKIREIRKQTGTQENVASRVGTSQKMMSRYENGKQEPSFHTIVMLSKVCGVDLNYFVEWDEETGKRINPSRKNCENCKIRKLMKGLRELVSSMDDLTGDEEKRDGDLY